MVLILVRGEPVLGGGWEDTSLLRLLEMTGDPGLARVSKLKMPRSSFSRLDISGEVGGSDLHGEGSLLPSLGREPFVLIRGACRVEEGLVQEPLKEALGPLRELL